MPCMKGMAMPLDNYDLEDAYDINGPEQARQMYGNWVRNL
jgi:hypothetical protein